MHFKIRNEIQYFERYNRMQIYNNTPSFRFVSMGINVQNRTWNIKYSWKYNNLSIN